MIHELLLALNGIPGDIFADNKELQCYQIPEELDFLHASERSLLESVAQLGYVYAQIRGVLDAWNRAGEPEAEQAKPSKRSVKRLQAGNAEPTQALESDAFALTEGQQIREVPLVPSSYRTALANAIEEQVLEGYRQLIIENEKTLLPAMAADENAVLTSIAMISHIFSKYQIILPYVFDLICEIQRSPLDMHGTRLLSFLHSRSHVGIPQVRDMMKGLLRSCEDILLKQLASWMVFGVNFDPHLDWFVRGTGETDEGQQTGAFAQAARSRDKSKWHTEFTLETSMLPSYISEQTAESILFVGRSMNTMRNSGVSDIPLERSIDDRLDVLGNADGSMHSVQFDVTIDNIKRDVSLKIWDVVMRVGELEAILTMFRSVFLLANGSLFTAFLDGTAEVMGKAHARKSAVTEHDTNQLWRKVARAHLSTDDSIVEAFNFRVVDRQQGAEQLPFDDFLFGVPLRFTYDLKWPMDLIFTDQDMQCYSIIFTFLLSLKQTQAQMQQVFRLVGRQTADNQLPEPLRRKLQTTRTTMQFFLDAILHYTQYDILESGYTKLLEAVQAQKEFENIQKHHRTFLASLMSGCFLDQEMYRGVGKTVRAMLELCQKFAGIAERNVRGNSSHLVEDMIDEIDNQFWLNMLSIYETFTGVISTMRQNQFLDQLVLRLDFNGFLSVARSIQDIERDQQEVRERLAAAQM